MAKVVRDTSCTQHFYLQTASFQGLFGIKKICFLPEPSKGKERRRKQQIFNLSIIPDEIPDELLECVIKVLGISEINIAELCKSIISICF